MFAAYGDQAVVCYQMVQSMVTQHLTENSARAFRTPLCIGLIVPFCV